MGKPTVFIDGAEGTTGLQIHSRLNQRDDIEMFLRGCFLGSGALLPVGGAIDGSALLHKRSPPNGGLVHAERAGSACPIGHRWVLLV